MVTRTTSPWAYGGRLLFLSEDGLTYVVRAGPAFEIFVRNPLNELCPASPAVAGGRRREPYRLRFVLEKQIVRSDGHHHAAPIAATTASRYPAKM